jgi:hypothetical protein
MTCAWLGDWITSSEVANSSTSCLVVLDVDLTGELNVDRCHVQQSDLVSRPTNLLSREVTLGSPSNIEFIPTHCSTLPHC